MISAIFYFHSFFLKYELGVKLTPLAGKTLLVKPSLIRFNLSLMLQLFIEAFTYLSVNKIQVKDKLHEHTTVYPNIFIVLVFTWMPRCKTAIRTTA